KEQRAKQYCSEYQKQLDELVCKRDNDIAQDLDRKDLEQVLDKALNRLSPKKQQIFFQSRYEEKSYKEIASDMQTTPKAVERHMAKTLHYLKKHISTHYSILVYFYFLLN